MTMSGVSQPQCHSHRHRSLPAGSKEWVKYQEAEYKFFEHHSTWLQAQRICSWFQAELTSVHSKAELHFLGQNLKKVPRGQELPGARVGCSSLSSSTLFWRDNTWGFWALQGS